MVLGFMNELQNPAIGVFHLPKNSLCAPARALDVFPLKPLTIDTCQRTILVFPMNWMNEKPQFGLAARKLGLEFYGGIKAYRFMLEVSCGLKSAVPGETEIFGQIKKAWNLFEAEEKSAKSLTVKKLRPWVRLLIEDTKWIRHSHLQHLGSSSYGSLLRKTLPKEGAGQVFVLGAGAISESILPFLKNRRIRISNRSPERLSNLKERLLSKHGIEVELTAYQSPDFYEHWKKSDVGIICVPFEKERDGILLQESPGSVVHLGSYRKDWEDLGVSEKIKFHCLDDLMSLSHEHQNIRSHQIARALDACTLRSMDRLSKGTIRSFHACEKLHLQVG